MGTEIVPISAEQGAVAQVGGVAIPALVERAGRAARFAWEEFFAEIPNEHTRKAYAHAVRLFLGWCEVHGVELVNVTPGVVGQYFVEHSGGPPTKKQHLAAVRKLFDKLVIRHAVILNPALSVRTERYAVVEGKTPEIGVENARKLLRSIDTSNVVGLRDRAVIAVLVYTAVRAVGVSKLNLKSFQFDGQQWNFRFEEKRGKSREIPARHDLERIVREYQEAAGIKDGPKDEPLFRSAKGKTKTLTANRMTGIDICRMVKRRLKDSKLPLILSPHSFRVTAITDLLDQGVPLEDVQYLAGHADSRTTALYDRRKKKVTRNIVERISV